MSIKAFVSRILIFIFSLGALAAQDTKAIDSLTRLLTPIRADSNRVNVLLGLGNAHYPSNLNKALEFADEAINLSNQLNYTKGSANGNYLAAKVSNRQGEIKLALVYYSRSLELFVELRDVVSMGNVYNNVGIIHKNRADYSMAKKNYEEALKRYEEAGDKGGIGSIYTNLGIVYQLLGDPEKSIEHYIDALKIFEEVGDLTGIANSHGNLGNLYKQQKDYEKAIAYYGTAQEYFDSLGMKHQVAKTIGNMGMIYFYLDKLDQALVANNAAKVLYEELDDEEGFATTAVSLGKIYHAQKKYIKALEQFNAGLSLYKRLNFPAYVSEVYAYIGDIYLKMGSYDSARVNLDKALVIAGEIGNSEVSIRIYENLSKYYEAIGDDAKALDYYKFYSVQKDSLFNIQRSEQVTEIQTRYGTEKKEQENELLRKDQEIKDAIIERKNIENTGLAVGAFIIIGVVFYLLYINNQRRKINELLEGQNEQIEQKKAQISQINVNLKESERRLQDTNHKLTGLNVELEERVQDRTRALARINAELDTFLYQSSHALRRPIAQVKGLIHLAQLDSTGLAVEEIYERIEETADRMDIMLRKLVTASEINFLEEHPIQLDLKEMLMDIWNLLMTYHDTSTLEFTAEIEEGITYETDPLLIRMIFTNLLENALRFRSTSYNREGFIKVFIFKDSSFLHFKVEDNGMGISHEVINEVFDIFAVGTDKTQGFGLGLYLVRKAVEKMKGKIMVESKENKYANFHVELPIVPVFD